MIRGARAFSVAILHLAVLVGPIALRGETIVSPGSAAVAAGEEFAIPVNVANASDLFAFQFDLSFDRSVLRLLDITEGSFLLSTGGTIFVPGAIDNTGGVATATGGSVTGSIPGVSGSGALAEFHFRALAPGTSPLVLSNLVLLDSALNDIAGTVADGSVSVSAAMTPEPAGLSAVGLTALAAALLAKHRRHARS